jgi:hypothetical protein
MPYLQDVVLKDIESLKRHQNEPEFGKRYEQVSRVETEEDPHVVVIIQKSSGLVICSRRIINEGNDDSNSDVNIEYEGSSADKELSGIPNSPCIPVTVVEWVVSSTGVVDVFNVEFLMDGVSQDGVLVVRMGCEGYHIVTCNNNDIVNDRESHKSPHANEKGDVRDSSQSGHSLSYSYWLEVGVWSIH